MTTPTKVERSYPRDLEAEIRFLATSENGRNGPARTGYRCQFRYDGQDWFGLFTFPETGTAEPGETVRAYVSFLSPEEQRSTLYVGKQFEVREGARGRKRHSHQNH